MNANSSTSVLTEHAVFHNHTIACKTFWIKCLLQSMLCHSSMEYPFPTSIHEQRRWLATTHPTWLSLPLCIHMCSFKIPSYLLIPTFSIYCALLLLVYIILLAFVTLRLASFHWEWSLCDGQNVRFIKSFLASVYGWSAVMMVKTN